MKTALLTTMSFFALVLTVTAQLQIGTQMSYLQGHGKNDNHTSLIGATIYGMYTLTDNISVGSVIHAYQPKKTQYYDGNTLYSATDDVTNISSSFDMIIGTMGIVETYVGADIGVSLSNHNVEYKNSANATSTYMMKQAFFMLSPKAGINLAITNGIGFFSQVQYNFAPGNGGKAKMKLYNIKSVSEINTEPISKYFNIDTGIYFKLGNIKTIL